MNTTLTKEEQEIVDNEAKDRYPIQMHGMPSSKEQFDSNEYERDIWKAGIKFAVEKLFSSRAQKFLLWADDHYMQDRSNNDSWIDLSTGQSYTTEQLYNLFEEYLKQKEG